MANAIIQLLSLLNGLLANFGLPAIYGVPAYGEFIQQYALVYFVHKTAAIVSEPLIRFQNGRNIVVLSLMYYLLIFAVFAPIQIFFGLGDLLLFASLLLSSCVLLSLDTMRLRIALMIFIAAVVGLMLGMLIWPLLGGQRFEIEEVVTVSTLAPAVVAIGYLLIKNASVPSWQDLKTDFASLCRIVPQALTLTGVYNIVINGMPFILSRALSAEAMGIFRISLSVIQFSASIFPVNTRALTRAFSTGEDTGRAHYIVTVAAIVYFCGVAGGLVLLGMIAPQLAPYVLLAACVPTFFTALLFEKAALGRDNLRPLMLINSVVAAACIVVGLLFVQTIDHALLLVSGGLAVYGLCLSVLVQAQRRLFVQSLLVLCPVVVAFHVGQSWLALAYLSAFALWGILGRGFTLREAHTAWKSL